MRRTGRPRPQNPHMTDWDLVVSSVLNLLSRRAIRPDQAEAWLTALVESADQSGK